ncbi:monoamine oxidase [Virgibacillus natechei]|uniref:Monoamine oxidase n=1 Tax=Virgibacillus natechei TaxID=1216297 RepID=A0ABS4II31_9BACI|nr:flavin monoamine oxidase family protein [Virgibacillus natechei]MBP1970235.1 monoamine oxidase [Virgibacillus natechei]UZD12817.1 flavin monoamine oxidase family protein [Virgibacillus natechei]
MNSYSASASSLAYPDDMLPIIKNGLRQSSSLKKVIIVGAGMAGLVAASLLKQAGHNVTILEGNNRIGGRILTIRQPFFQGNYLDVGAMRLPDNHVLLSEYIRHFKLRTNPFIQPSPNDLTFANNKLTTRSTYEQNPDILGFPLQGWEKGKTAAELFFLAVQPYIDLYSTSTPKQQAELRKKYDHYSIRNFLRHNPLGPSLSANAIRKINVLFGISGITEHSFVDALTVILPIITQETFYELSGGNDSLPFSFLPALYNDILYGQKVEKIIQKEKEVSLITKDRVTGDLHEFSGDFSVITVPFSLFKFIDVVPHHSISSKKWRAIRELNYVPAVKIGIEFKHRFWEYDQVGNSTSDLPIQFSITPSPTNGSHESGVLLASYSWGQDAMLWNSLAKEDIIRYVLKDLANVYGKQVYDEYLQAVSFNWSQNPFSAGCFTLYTPGQETAFGDSIPRPEGRLHFAGEHASSFHGWVEGAIESGIRAAYDVNTIRE